MHSMTTLAHSRFRCQGALSQACANLSRNGNDESGIGCKPLLAGLPETLPHCSELPWRIVWGWSVQAP